MILRILNINQIKELRGCTRALSLIDDFVGNRLDFEMNETHKVIHFFEKFIQLLIRKGHTYHKGKLQSFYVSDYSFQKYKETYMSFMFDYLFNQPDVQKDLIDNIDILNSNLDCWGVESVSQTYIQYTIISNGNKFAKKEQEQLSYKSNDTRIYYDTYKIKCKQCNSFVCRSYLKN
jgi:hypothetical protein